MSRSIIEILRRAYALLDDKKKWTINTSARNAWGISTDPRGSAAVCWCATGAVIKFAKDDGRMEAAVAALDAECPLGTYMTNVNDTMGYAAMRAVFRRAIKKRSR